MENIKEKPRLIIDDLKVARALYKAALLYPANTPRRWHNIAAQMERQFGLGKSVSTWRNLCFRLRIRYGLHKSGQDSHYYDYIQRRPLEELLQEEEPAAIDTAGEPYGELFEYEPELIVPRVSRISDNAAGIPSEAAILKALENKRKPDELAAEFKIPPRVLSAFLEELRENGYQILEANGIVWHEKRMIQKPNVIVDDWKGTRRIKVGVVSDTHFCNKFQQKTTLNTFYDYFADNGVEDVIHGGDLSDGHYLSRPEHLYELIRHGVDEQADYIIDNYPARKGIRTRFITGNHDATHVKNGGGDIGKRIAAARPDMQYLGYGKAKIWLTPKCDIDVVHPLGGKAYALSYKLQKAIDAMHGGTKPRILLMGHYHAYCKLWYRNVHAWMLPSCVAQNTWSSLEMLLAHIGALVLEIEVASDGEVVEVFERLRPVYITKENDY